MDSVIMFALGYVAGAKGGADNFDDVVRSFHAIRKSQEFQDFREVIRSHAGFALRQLSEWLEERNPATTGGSDVMSRVRGLMQTGSDRFSAA